MDIRPRGLLTRCGPPSALLAVLTLLTWLRPSSNEAGHTTVFQPEIAISPPESMVPTTTSALWVSAPHTDSLIDAVFDIISACSTVSSPDYSTTHGTSSTLPTTTIASITTLPAATASSSAFFWNLVPQPILSFHLPLLKRHLDDQASPSDPLMVFLFRILCNQALLGWVSLAVIVLSLLPSREQPRQVRHRRRVLRMHHVARRGSSRSSCRTCATAWKSIQAANGNVKTLKHEALQSRRLLATRQKDLEGLQASHSKEIVALNEKLKSHLDNAAEESSSARKELQDVRNRELVAQGHCANLRKELVRTNRDLSTKAKALADAYTVSEQIHADLEQKLADTTEECHAKHRAWRLGKQMAAREQELHNEQVVVLESKIETLTNEKSEQAEIINEKDEEILGHQQMLISDFHVNENKRLKDQISNLQGNVTTLDSNLLNARSEVTALQGQLQEAELASKKLALASQTITSLQSQLSSAQADTAKLQVKVESAAQEAEQRQLEQQHSGTQTDPVVHLTATEVQVMPSQLSVQVFSTLAESYPVEPEVQVITVTEHDAARKADRDLYEESYAETEKQLELRTGELQQEAHMRAHTENQANNILKEGIELYTQHEQLKITAAERLGEITKLKQVCFELNRKKGESEEALRDLQKQGTAAEKTYTRDLKSTQDQLASAEGKLKTALQDVGILEENLKIARRTASDNNAERLKIQKMDIDINKDLMEMLDVSEDLTDTRAERDALESTVTGLQVQVKSLHEAMDAVEAENSQLRRKLGMPEIQGRQARMQIVEWHTAPSTMATPSSTANPTKSVEDTPMLDVTIDPAGEAPVVAERKTTSGGLPGPPRFLTKEGQAIFASQQVRAREAVARQKQKEQEASRREEDKWDAEEMLQAVRKGPIYVEPPMPAPNPIWRIAGQKQQQQRTSQTNSTPATQSLILTGQRSLPPAPLNSLDWAPSPTLPTNPSLPTSVTTSDWDPYLTDQTEPYAQPQTPEPGSPKSTYGGSAQMTYEDSPQMTFEESPKSTYGGSPQTTLEEPPKMTSEESPKTPSKESPKTPSRESPVSLTKRSSERRRLRGLF